MKVVQGQQKNLSSPHSPKGRRAFFSLSLSLSRFLLLLSFSRSSPEHVDDPGLTMPKKDEKCLYEVKRTKGRFFVDWFSMLCHRIFFSALFVPTPLVQLTTSFLPLTRRSSASPRTRRRSVRTERLRGCLVDSVDTKSLFFLSFSTKKKQKHSLTLNLNTPLPLPFPPPPPPARDPQGLPPPRGPAPPGQEPGGRGDWLFFLGRERRRRRERERERQRQKPFSHSLTSLLQFP